MNETFVLSPISSAGAAKAVGWMFVILEVLLALRFIFKLSAAFPTSAFTAILFGTTEIFVGPILRVFGISEIHGITCEWPTLLSMYAYWALGELIVRRIQRPRALRTDRSKQGLDS